MQGRSLVKLLRGESTSLRDAFLYEYDTENPFPVVPSIFAVRTPAWKYVVYPHSSDEELYDLGSDPGEITNLAGRPEAQATRSALRQRLDRLLEETAAPLP